MEFFDAVNKRYSYRGKFTSAPLPDADLRKMLKAALHAPSGLNKQTTSFVAVTDKALIAKLNEIFPHPGIASAPAVIVALSERVECYQGVAFELQDYAAAVATLLLAVTDLGYATVWTDGQTDDGDRPRQIAELLNIPAGKKVQALLPVGVPETPGTQKEKDPFENRVHYNRFE